MIAVANHPLRVVLYEGEAAQPLPPEVRFEITRTLLDAGYSVLNFRERQPVSRVENGTLVMLGQFNGTVPEIDSPDDVELRFRDITGLQAADVVGLVDQLRVEQNAPQPRAWKPWFPVIDYNRCTNCMQCLSFCLFDVYGVSGESKIQVQNQSNCKTDCPACSRVCPEVAILFPKYKAGPINGDEIDAEDLRREAMKVDISALLGGDIYAMLRDRSAKAKSRFSKERDDERALKERQRCLAKLQEQLEVPPEVLASLPSPDEIQAKAAAARSKADQVRQQIASTPST